MPDVILTADLRLGNQTSFERQIRDLERRVASSLRVDNSLPVGRLSTKVSEFDKSLEAANARVVAFGASAGVIAGITTAIKQMAEQAVKVEKSLADINVVLNLSNTSLAKFSNDLFAVARNTGQAFSEVAKAATEFSRQGLSAEDVLKRTRDALILTRLSGLEAEKAVSTLTATINSFNKEALDSETIINKLANVDAKFAVSSRDLAEGLSRAGATAQDANVHFDELIGLITAAQQRTARGGAVIGNALKSIFTRISRPEVLDQLEELGIGVRTLDGSMLSGIQILNNFAKSLDTLSASQKQQVSELVGGIFQINQLKSLLGDLASKNSIAAQATRTASEATDEAIQRNETLNKTLSALAASASTNFTKLASQFGKSLFGPSLERIFGQFNEFSDQFDGKGIGEKVGKGILDGIGNALSGPGLVFGTFLGAKLFSQFTQFATEALGNLSGIGKESRQVQEVQQGINELLKQEPTLQEAILQKTISTAEAEERILAIIQQQVTARKILSEETNAIALSTTEEGLRYNPFSRNFKIKNKAVGHIPISQVPPEAIANEVEGARKQGYYIGPENVRAMRAKINGQPTTVVYNSREKIIDNFAGSGEPAIIPPGKSIEALQNLYAGFVHADSGMAPVPFNLTKKDVGEYISGGGFRNVYEFGNDKILSYPKTESGVLKTYETFYKRPLSQDEAEVYLTARKRENATRPYAQQALGETGLGPKVHTIFDNGAFIADRVNMPTLSSLRRSDTISAEEANKVLKKARTALAKVGFKDPDLNHGNVAYDPKSKKFQVLDLASGYAPSLGDFITALGKATTPENGGLARLASKNTRGFALRSLISQSHPEISDNLLSGDLKRLLIHTPPNTLKNLINNGVIKGVSPDNVDILHDLQHSNVKNYAEGNIFGNDKFGDIKVRYNALDPEKFPQIPKAFQSLSDFFSDKIGLSKKDVAPFSFDKLGIPEIDYRGAYYPEENRIHVSQRNIAENVKSRFGYSTGDPRFNVKVGNDAAHIITHEGFHNAFTKAPKETLAAFKKLNQEKGLGLVIPKNEQEALQFIADHYYSGVVKKARTTYGRIPKEEALAIQFPRLLGFSSGYLPYMNYASGLYDPANKRSADFSFLDGLSDNQLSDYAQEHGRGIPANVSARGRSAVIDYLKKVLVAPITGEGTVLKDNARAFPPYEARASQASARRQQYISDYLTQDNIGGQGRAPISNIVSSVYTPDSGPTAGDYTSPKGRGIFSQKFFPQSAAELQTRQVLSNAGADDDYITKLILSERKRNPVRPVANIDPRIRDTGGIFRFGDKIRADGTVESALERNQRFTNRGFQASFAVPLLGGIASELVSNPQGQRAISGATNAIGSGLAVGSIVGGPAGIAIGGLISSFGALKSIIDNLNPSLQDLQQKYAKEAEERETPINALGNINGITENIKGGTLSESQLKLALSQRELALGKIDNVTDRNSISNSGFDEDVVNNILDRRVADDSRRKAAAQASLILKGNSERFANSSSLASRYLSSGAIGLNSIFGLNIGGDAGLNTVSGFESEEGQKDFNALSSRLRQTIDDEALKNGGDKTFLSKLGQVSKNFSFTNESGALGAQNTIKFQGETISSDEATKKLGKQLEDAGFTDASKSLEGIKNNTVGIEQSKAIQAFLNAALKAGGEKAKEAAKAQELYNKNLEIGTRSLQNRIDALVRENNASKNLAQLAVNKQIGGFATQNSQLLISSAQDVQSSLVNGGLGFLGNGVTASSKSRISNQLEQQGIRLSFGQRIAENRDNVSDELAQARFRPVGVLNEAIAGINSFEGEKTNSIRGRLARRNNALSEQGFDVSDIQKSVNDLRDVLTEQNDPKKKEIIQKYIFALEQQIDSQENINKVGKAQETALKQQEQLQLEKVRLIKEGNDIIIRQNLLASQFNFEKTLKDGGRENSGIQALADAQTSGLQLQQNLRRNVDFRIFTRPGQQAIRNNQADVAIAGAQAIQQQVEQGLLPSRDIIGAQLENSGQLLNETEYNKRYGNKPNANYGIYRNAIIDRSPLGARFNNAFTTLTAGNIAVENKAIQNDASSYTSGFLQNFSKFGFNGFSRVNDQTQKNLNTAINEGNYSAVQSIIGQLAQSPDINTTGRNLLQQYSGQITGLQTRKDTVAQFARDSASRTLGGTDLQLTNGTFKDVMGKLQTVMEAIRDGKNANATSSTPNVINAPVTVTINSTASAQDIADQLKTLTEEQLTSIIKRLSNLEKINDANRRGVPPPPSS